MKLGSVTFFKRLIIAGFAILVVVPIVLAVVFGVLYARQRQQTEWLETVNWALLNSESLPEDLDTPQAMLEFFQNPPADISIGPTFEYQTQYPSIYTQRYPFVETEGKICYLTFDDGPSAITLQILETLDEYGVQATFFVTGENTEENPEIIAAAAAAGHTIALHTYSHDYEEIYASVDAYLQDFERIYNAVEDITGAIPGVFRFPGGSVNVYNQDTYSEIIAEMLRRGFVFYDWNAAGDDAVVGGASRAAIVSNVLNDADNSQSDRLMVLLHDRQDTATTAAALPEIIEGLQERGYEFAAIKADVRPITFFVQE